MFFYFEFWIKPYGYPPNAKLPPCRSQKYLPFKTTGVNYLGPVLVKLIFNDIDSNYLYKSQIYPRNISWKFIVAAFPWWGAFWESLAQSVRRSLRKILFRSTVNYEELVTIVSEMKGIINCRPLTHLYHDNTEEVVTSSHPI